MDFANADLFEEFTPNHHDLASPTLDLVAPSNQSFKVNIEGLDLSNVEPLCAYAEELDTSRFNLSDLTQLSQFST
jgi:hypothetical protein